MVIKNAKTIIHRESVTNYFFLDKDLCVPNPCKNEGHCEALGFSFQCHCALGFKGNNCAGKLIFCPIQGSFPNVILCPTT